MPTVIEKCPTCGADAVNRSDFWEAAPDNGDELRSKIYLIQKAVKKYYLALDKREHGGIAQNQAFSEIEKILGMCWEQGKMLKQIEEHPKLKSIYEK